jgi:hypothetical protein
MPLIICPACDRRVKVGKARRARLRCSNCGALGARVVSNRQMHRLADSEESAGLNRDAARHMTFAGLKWQAEIKGYKPGWAGMKFKAMFGVWPNGESKEEAAAPGTGLVRWMYQQGQAFKKEMKAKGIPFVPTKKKVVATEKPSIIMSDEDWEVRL